MHDCKYQLNLKNLLKQGLYERVDISGVSGQNGCCNCFLCAQPHACGAVAVQVVSAVVLGILLLAKLLTRNKYKNLPPGPRGLPIIGALHLLGKFPPRNFAKLAETYGPLMSLWLGPRLVVVASSPAAAEEILKTQGSNFANRITTSFCDVVCPGGDELPPLPALEN